MTVELLFSSLLLILAILQIVVAGYILLLDSKSPSNRMLAAFLVVLAIINLADNILQSAFTLIEAKPWVVILLVGLNTISPLIYLASIATLRPLWLKKYAWFYKPLIGFLFFPAIVLILDLLGLSQQFLKTTLLLTLPAPTQFTTSNVLLEIADDGLLHTFFFATHLVFSGLLLICPSLVVAWKDRHRSPQNARIAWFYVFATILTILFQGRIIQLADESVALTITSLLFLTLAIYITLVRTSFDDQTRQIQRAFRTWSVFWKLMGAISLVIIVISLAVGITTLTVLRINTIRSEGRKLSVLAQAQTRNIGDEVLNEITQLNELAHNEQLISTVDLQNRQYRFAAPETTEEQLTLTELTWQTSAPQDLTGYLERYMPSYNTLLEYQAGSRNHELIYAVDNHGVIVTGTAPPDRYRANETTWWRNIFVNNQINVNISPIYYDAIAQKYYIEIAIPIVDAFNQPLGILYSRYNIQTLLNRVNSIQFGETGKAALFNSLGFRLPAISDQPPEDTGLNWENLQILSQPWSVLTYQGQDHLIAWTEIGPLYPSTLLQDLHWRIVFTQTTQEILTPIRLVSLTSNIVLVGTVLTAIFIAGILSRILTYPLNKLNRNAALISQGNLNIRAEEITEDEFGALATSFNTMTEQLQTFISNLEQQVEERTYALQQRANQIRAAVDIGNTVANIRDIRELLPKVTHLISERFSFYHVGIFILDENQEYAVLQAANSTGGQRMLARQHALKVGEVGIVGYVAKHKLPRIALDVGEDAVYFNNPDLPETRSEMALPILSGGQIIGVLDVQSTQAQAFTQEDISILQLLADQLAVAIENANLFSLNEKALAESQTALDASRRAYRDLSREGWKELARESRILSYRATPRGVVPLNDEIPPIITRTARAGHPTLPNPETLALPIKIQDHVMGVMQLKKEGSESWSAKEINFIENIVEQLGTAIESARLYKETQSSLIRTESLYQVIRAATSYENTEELLLAVANTIAGTLPAFRVLVGTLDIPKEKVLQFIENNAAPQEITPGLFNSLMNGLTGWAISNRQPALSPKGESDSRESREAQEHRRENELGSIVVVPMFYQERPLGTITAIKKITEPDFTSDDVDLLTAMANQLAAALTNAELLIQTRKRALQLETSTEISRAISSILEQERLLPQVVQLLQSRFAYYFVGLFLVDETKEWAVLRAAVGEEGQNPIPAGFRFHLDETNNVGQVIMTQQGRILLDVGVDAVIFENPYLPASRSEMILPLNSRGRAIGAIAIQSEAPLAFNPDDLNVFQIMSDQIASAIDNAILFEANNRRLQTSTILLEITQVASTSLQLTQILSEIAQRTAKATQAFRCMLYLIDQNNHIHPRMAQFADGHLDLKQWEMFKSLGSGPLTDYPLFAETISRRQPILITNLAERGDLVPLEWIKPFHQKVLLSAPLISQDRGIGILMLDQISPVHSFNQEQIDLTVTIAGQAAAIIENARLFQEQEQRSRELRQLNQISLELSQTQMDLAPAIIILSTRAMQLLDSDGGGLWFWREATQELELMHSFQEEGIHLKGRRLKLGEGLSGKALEGRSMLVIDDYATWLGHAQPFTDLPIHAALAVPLFQQGAPLGVLVVNRSQPGKLYTSDQQNLALLLANQTASFIRTARLFQETQEALVREQRERRVASILAQTAEKIGTAYGEHNIRQAMLDEIRDVVLSEKIILYEWHDTQNVFIIDIQFNSNPEEDIYPNGHIFTPDSREDLWTSFSTHQPLYNLITDPNGLVKEQYIIPWMSGQLPMGVIEIFVTPEQTKIRDLDKESIQGIVRLASVSIQSARLFEQTQEALTRTEALYEVSQAATSMGNLPTLLQAIVDRIADSLPADRVLLITLETESRKVTSFVESGMPTGNIVPLAYEELMQGLTGWVMQERKPALSLKSRKDERESETVYQHRLMAGSGSIVVVPLLYRDQILGTLTATNDIDHPDFNNEDVTLLTAMASQAAAAIENARLFNQTQQRALLLQTAAEVSNAASSILELSQLLPEVVELIRERFNLYYVGIFLVDEARRYAVLRAGTGDAGRIQISQNHRLRLNFQSMIGRCILETKPQIAQEIGAETIFFKNPYLPETRSELALPLSASGETLGAMTIQSIQPAAFSEDDITVLETLADQLAVAIENARFVAETRIRAENEQLLNQITTQLSRSLDLEAILQTAVREIGHLSRVNEVSIHLGELDFTPNPNKFPASLTDSQHDLRLPAPDQN